MQKLDPEFNQYKSNPNSHLSGWCKWKSRGRLSHMACSGNLLRPDQLSFPCACPCVQVVQCLCSVSRVQDRRWWSVGQWQRTGLLVTGLSLPAPPPCPSYTFSLMLCLFIGFLYCVPPVASPAQALEKQPAFSGASTMKLSSRSPQDM